MRWHLQFGATAAFVGLVAIVGLAYFAANGNEQLVSLMVRSGGS